MFERSNEPLRNLNETFGTNLVEFLSNNQIKKVFRNKKPNVKYVRVFYYKVTRKLLSG